MCGKGACADRNIVWPRGCPPGKLARRCKNLNIMQRLIKADPQDTTQEIGLLNTNREIRCHHPRISQKIHSISTIKARENEKNREPFPKQGTRGEPLFLFNRSGRNMGRMTEEPIYSC